MGRLTRRECAGIVFGSRQQYEIGLVHRNRVGSEAVLFCFSQTSSSSSSSHRTGEETERGEEGDDFCRSVSLSHETTVQ